MAVSARDRLRNRKNKGSEVLEEVKEVIPKEIIQDSIETFENPSYGRSFRPGFTAQVSQELSRNGNIEFDSYGRPLRPETISYEPAQRNDSAINVRTGSSYTKPDAVGFSMLGMNNSESIKLVKPRVLTITPLKLDNIIDTSGSISIYLEKLMAQTGATVLPLRECGVFESIMQISGFDIIEVKGKRYASYAGNNYPTTYVDSLKNRITDRLLCAQPFGASAHQGDFTSTTWNQDESRLSRVVNILGTQMEVPSLCVSEMEYIYTYFQNYFPNILTVAGDYSHLIVGVNLDGGITN